MDKTKFFQDLGFTEYESKALSSLVNLKKATPKQISLDSGVPQNKIYTIINKFKSLDIISEILSQTKKYKLINIKTFIKDRINEKQKKLKQLEKSSEQLENLEDNEEEFTFQLIKGQKAIMDRLAEHNKEAEKEIFGVQRNWKYWAKGIRQMEKAIKKGVDVRLIGIVNDKTWGKVKEWKKIGCKIGKYDKEFGDYPLRFSVSDNKTARITIGKPEIKKPEDYITIWTDSKPLVRMLRNQFMKMWKECEKV